MKTIILIFLFFCVSVMAEEHFTNCHINKAANTQGLGNENGITKKCGSGNNTKDFTATYVTCRDSSGVNQTIFAICERNKNTSGNITDFDQSQLNLCVEHSLKQDEK